MQFSGEEVSFNENDFIVSKTDLTGKLTYTNKLFLDVAGYSEDEVLGKQHNIIRHKNMPRAIFELLWSTLKQEKEIFAYVVNSTKSGGHYWVIAHVTPSKQNGSVMGYHSTRRVPNRKVINDIIIPLYDQLNQIESSNSSKKAGLEASVAALNDTLAKRGQSYEEFIAGLENAS